MKMSNCITFIFSVFFFFFTTHLLGKEPVESEQIVVRLSTESQLLPIYLAHISDERGSLEAGYLSKLEGILDFDLNHNGMTYTIDQSTEKERLATKLITQDGISASAWRPFNVMYAVKVHIKDDKKVFVSMLSVNGNTLKSAEGITLTGDFAQDRRKMHQIADVIHKTLFGTDGIATTHVLYTVKKRGDNKTWTSEIWESDYDGGNPHQVLHEAGYPITPSYIPPKAGYTSGNFFYVSYKSSQPKIYLASLKGGSESRRLMTLHGNQLTPAISRQRDQIAFISDATGNPDIFLQSFNADSGAIGKPRLIFTHKQATQGSPTFSPDGKKIAFVSNKDGSARIYMMNIPAPGVSLKDLKPQLLTKHNQESSAPNWSPDGTKIAYCAKIDGVRQIWVYDLERKEEKQLTQGAINKENPSWAPNSLNLMYNSSDVDSCELYLINLNQPSAVKITSGGGEKRFPNWEPRGYVD